MVPSLLIVLRSDDIVLRPTGLEQPRVFYLERLTKTLASGLLLMLNKCSIMLGETVMKKLKKGARKSKRRQTKSQSIRPVKAYPTCVESNKGSFDIDFETTSSSSLDERLYFSFPSAKTYTTSTSLSSCLSPQPYHSRACPEMPGRSWLGKKNKVSRLTKRKK